MIVISIKKQLHNKIISNTVHDVKYKYKIFNSKPQEEKIKIYQALLTLIPKK